MRMRRPSRVRLKVPGGPKARANLARGGATNMSASTDKVPAIKELNAAIPSACPRAALPGHLVPVQAGHDRCRFPRDVHENGSRGAAIHGSVVDPRQHDDRRNGRKVKGVRQQQGNRRGRAEAG